jgi:hypothetical protein
LPPKLLPNRSLGASGLDYSKLEPHIDPYCHRICVHRSGCVRPEAQRDRNRQVRPGFLDNFSDVCRRANVGSCDCAAGRKSVRAILAVATLRDNGVDRASLNRLSGQQGATLQPGRGICRNHPPIADFSSSSLNRHITAKMAM